MQYLNTVLLILILLLTLYGALKQRTPRFRGQASRPVLLDSSALIDGRVVDVAKSGFMAQVLLVPSSVLREMQYLADTGDQDKRARARYGLDVVKELQSVESVTVKIIDDGLPQEGGVDERLVTLCKEYNGSLLTLDFNLNKVADVEGIEVLNINQLAQILRMSYLPGEKRDITLVQKGQDSTQAVGYLEDGTMVVVEKAGQDIGTSVEVEFTRALQTQAGKMLFAKKTSNANSAPQKQSVKTKKSHTPSPMSPVQSSTPRSTQKPRPQVAPQQQASQQENPRPPRQQPRKRRTPEDSLVELANK